MTGTERDKIKTGIVDYLTADSSNTTFVAMIAYSFRQYHTAITPIFRELVADGRVEIAYQSAAGGAVYRAVTPRLIGGAS